MYTSSLYKGMRGWRESSLGVPYERLCSTAGTVLPSSTRICCARMTIGEPDPNRIGFRYLDKQQRSAHLPT
jgi:hypothetical protein